MSLHVRALIAALALAFLAGPTLALAATACHTCCCPAQACDEGASDCVRLGATPCCDDAATALPGVAKRTLEPPTVQPTPSPHATAAWSPPHAYGPASVARLSLLTSRLRFSVVRRT